MSRMDPPDTADREDWLWSTCPTCGDRIWIDPRDSDDLPPGPFPCRACEQQKEFRDLQVTRGLQRMVNE